VGRAPRFDAPRPHIHRYPAARIPSLQREEDDVKFKGIAALFAPLLSMPGPAAEAVHLFDIDDAGAKVGEMTIRGQSVHLWLGDPQAGVHWPDPGGQRVTGAGSVRYLGVDIESLVFQLLVRGADCESGQRYLVVSLRDESFVQVSRAGGTPALRRFDLVPVLPEPVYLMRAGRGLFGLHARRARVAAPADGRPARRGPGRLSCG
jgi:hypothetical protein